MQWNLVPLSRGGLAGIDPGATGVTYRFYYYLELVNCATVEAFDVQIAYTR